MNVSEAVASRILELCKERDITVMNIPHKNEQLNRIS